MAETIWIEVDGERRAVEAGAMLASALLGLGVACFRNSVTGEARAPVCGMGVCQECRVTVDGLAQQRSCLIPCREHMKVTTG